MVVIYKNKFYSVPLYDAAGREFGVQEFKRYVLFQRNGIARLTFLRVTVQSVRRNLQERIGCRPGRWNPYWS